MNIELTQKDADWVASKMREQINDLNEAYEDAMKSGTSRSEFCYSLYRNLFSQEPKGEVEKDLAELKQTEMESIRKLKELYNTRLSTYQRIIELMMCGSETG